MLDKWQKRLDELAKISRCNSIWLWHEETLARMRANVMYLEIKKRSYSPQN